jgi:hypothetical protein
MQADLGTHPGLPRVPNPAAKDSPDNGSPHRSRITTSTSAARRPDRPDHITPTGDHFVARLRPEATAASTSPRRVRADTVPTDHTITNTQKINKPRPRETSDQQPAELTSRVGPHPKTGPSCDLWVPPTTQECSWAPGKRRFRAAGDSALVRANTMNRSDLLGQRQSKPSVLLRESASIEPHALHAS